MLNALPSTAASGPLPLSRRRKAALIVQLLISDGSKLALSSMPDHVQEDLARELAAIRLVDRETVNAVATEFADLLDAVGLSAPGNVDAALEALAGQISPHLADKLRDQIDNRHGRDPWLRLQNLTTDDVVRILSQESIQIGAVLLSKLPVARAAETLRFRLHLDRANLLCCRPVAGTENEFTFTVDTPLTGLRLLVRDDARGKPVTLDELVDPFAVNASLVGTRRPAREAAQAGPVELDGQRVELADPCGELPEGIGEFYRASQRLDLAPGTHVVRLLGTVDDAPYLPALFVAGDMGVFSGNRLDALPTTVGLGDLRDCGLLHYAGKVTLSGVLPIPSANQLELATGEHLAQLRLAGRDLGERLWAPFRWELPADLPQRLVGFELTLTTSIGAIFGTKEAVPAGGLAAFWTGQHAPLGILRPPGFRQSTSE